MIRLPIFSALIFASCFSFAQATCGNNHAGGSNETIGNNVQAASTVCTPSSPNLQIQDCQVHTGANSGTGKQLICGVWDITAGAPSTLVCSSSAVAPLNFAWNVLTFPSPCILTSGHQYYLGVNSTASGGSLIFDYDTAGSPTFYFQSATCCTLVNFSSPSTFGTQNLSVFLDLVPAGTMRLRGSVVTSQ